MEVGPTSHSALGASGAKRWLRCPGSVRLSVGQPDESGPAAKEGTAAHAVGELAITQGLDAAYFVGTSIDVEGTKIVVTDEMAEAVQVYVDFAKEVAEELDAEVHTEVEVYPLEERPTMFGTADLHCGQLFGKLIVVDYKNGSGVLVPVVEFRDPDPEYPVEAHTHNIFGCLPNEQLLYYGLGALRLGVYEEVELVIVQPNCVGDLGAVRRHTVSAEDLRSWGRGVLLPGANQAEKPGAPLRAGAHCRWCRAAAICPKARELATQAAQLAFDPVAQAETPALPPTATLTPLQKGRVLAFAGVLETWVKAVKDDVKRGLLDGTLQPDDVGVKLVQGRATRKWTDDDAVIAAVYPVLGEETFDHKVRSPAQMEKALKAAGLDKAAVAHFITSSHGVSVVPLNDRRPAIEPSGRAFKELPE